MDENARNAVEWADEFPGSPDCKTPTYWQTIRAHLAGLEVSLADYKNANEHAADDCLAKDAEIARLQSRLAAADALLRECTRYLNPHHFPDTIKRIDAHLSENGYEK